MKAVKKEVPEMLFFGNLSFTLCCVFYLIWWSVAFRPDTPAPKTLSALLFTLTVIFGLVGLCLIIGGMNSADTDKRLFPVYAVVAAGIIVYILLLALTSSLLHRQITTELILIVGWGMLALCEINTFYGTGRLGFPAAVVICVVVAAVMLASLICYIAYYNLEAHKAYIDGMLPLIMTGTMMAVFAALAFGK